MRTRANRLILGIALVATLGFLGPQGAAQASWTRPQQPALVTVGGAVSTPLSLTRSQLAELPQVTLVDERPGRGQGKHGKAELTGVALLTLIDQAAPVLPADAKNAALRVSATVSGAAHGHRSVAVARGELDPGSGNHPGLLVLSRNGHPVEGAPQLIFPGDGDRRRSVDEVRRIEVSVAPTVTTQPAAGDLTVTDGTRTTVLSAARLAALPQRTRTVTFQSGTGSQTRVETGPTLASVLRAARFASTGGTSVAASATDGYVAVVTPGEATSGKRPLLISLAEDGAALDRPRLVVDGDLKGGRYVSDLTTLTVSATCRT